MKDCSFLLVFSPYTKWPLRNKSLERMKTETIDYKQKDTIQFYKKAPFYLVENKLERVWRKKIKYEILNDIVAQNSNLDSIKESFATLELTSKKRTIENEICKINAILEKKSAFEEIY
jgi:carboxyl-terminal processing protease